MRKYSNTSRRDWLLSGDGSRKNSRYVSFWLSKGDCGRLDEYVRKYGSSKDGIRNVVFFNRSDFIREAVLKHLEDCIRGKELLLVKGESKKLASPGLLSLSGRVDAYLDELRTLEIKNRVESGMKLSRSVDNVLQGRDRKGLMQDETMDDFLSRKSDNERIVLKRKLMKELQNQSEEV